MISAIVSFLSGSNTTGLCAALVLASLVGGYTHGCSVGTAKGRAELNALKAEYAAERRTAAEAYGAAVASALEKYREEVARGDSLAASLMEKDKIHTTETRTLRRQIADATKNSAVVLGPDVVRLLNEAAGACVSDAALPGDVHTPGPDGRAAAGAAPCAGLLEQFNGVTEADFTDWFIIYARRAQWLEERYNAWRHLFGKRPANSGQGER